jgi:hypothetical protein
MEALMVKTIFVVVATAVPAFMAGIWTHTLLAEHQRAEAGTFSFIPTISPLEMHRNVKPDNLPVQYMQGDFD